MRPLVEFDDYDKTLQLGFWSQEAENADDTVEERLSLSNQNSPVIVEVRRIIVGYLDVFIPRMKLVHALLQKTLRSVTYDVTYAQS